MPCIARPALLTTALLAATALPAFAHAHLVSSTPPAGGSMAVPPAALVLHFTERVEPGFTGVALLDSARHTIATGPTALAGGDPAAITVPVMTTLPAGRYEVDWHALAVDGHKTSGSYTFVVTP